MESLKRFLVKLLILTAFTESFALLWYFFANPKYVIDSLPVLPLFFFAVTYIFHRFVTKNKNSKPNTFQRRYMLATTVKLIFLLSIIVAYVFTYPQNSKVFLISFFLLYLAYTAFEARSLIIKHKS